MIKFYSFLICFFIISNSYSNNVNKVDLKDLDKVLKQERYNRLVKINNGKLEIDQTPEKVYMFSTNKYYTDIAYNSTQTKELTSKSKTFLKKWLDAKYTQDSLEDSSDTKMILLNNQINIYYKEIVVVYNGKLYNFIIQTPLLNKIKNSVKQNTIIQVELMYLGKDYSSGNNFFIITDFSKEKIDKQIIKENNFLVAKTMINNGQYVAAIQKLDTFIKEHPNHLEARKNVCLAKYLNSLKLNNKEYTNGAVRCYEDLSKVYENNEVYYALASIYYSNNITNENTRYKNVLKYSEKAIEATNSVKNNDSNKLIYCGSTYLRGLAKMYFKNSDGLIDMETVQNTCPEMININTFR